MDPNSLGYPPLSPDSLQQNMLSSQAAYPVTVAAPNPRSQQSSIYQNASPAFSQSNIPLDQQRQQQQQQQQQRYSFGAVTTAPMMQSIGPGGAMMPPNFPQSSAPTNVSFSAPFSQPPIPTTMGQFPQPHGTSSLNVSSIPAPGFPPNMAPSVAANNVMAAQQRPDQRPNGPQFTAQAAAVQAQAAAREKARVATLLDINSTLLQEVVNLQSAGKSGVPVSQSGSQEANPNPSPMSETNEAPKSPARKPSQEYIEYMRRLQANLAYLASIADRAKKSGGVPPSAPAIMNPPPNTPVLNELYEKLNELFPRTARTGGAVGTPPSRPGLQATPQGNGKPSPSSASESAT